MAREKSIDGEVERITLRLPVDTYETIKRMAKLSPGQPAPAALLRNVIVGFTPQIQKMLDAYDAIKAGYVSEGLASLAATADLMKAMGADMSAQMTVAQRTTPGGSPLTLSDQSPEVIEQIGDQAVSNMQATVDMARKVQGHG